MNETWIHLYTPTSNRQSTEWRPKDNSQSKRTKMQQSANMVIASVFWYTHRLISKKEKTFSEYYVALLVGLKGEIAKTQGKKRKKMCNFTKTMHCLTSRRQRLQNCIKCTSIASTSTYSPDLASSDCSRSEISKKNTSERDIFQ